ncbi:HCL518Cp [Eremothecium sinecaudum]|uniref:HCL518Cp n=1 Tax=Eremothecium sinecaudum TaxID=45286 RepID=A0A109UY16_9SACH|nr:HCL518Cp [Eremothecium sinecaudum]AMD19633.1 HCL518Cp [Eremothecium sinecaudum]
MKFGKTFPNHQVPEWSHKYVNYKGLKKTIKQITTIQASIYEEENKTANSNQSGSVPKKKGSGWNSGDIYLNNTDVKKLLASFFFALDKDIEKVDSFYNSQFLECDRRLRKLLSSAQFTEISSQHSSLRNDNRLGLPNNLKISKNAQHHYGRNGMSNNNRSTTGFSVSDMIPSSSAAISEDIAEIISILIELRSQFRNLKWYGELNRRAFTKILKKLDKKVGTKQQHSYLKARITPLSFSNDSDIVSHLSLINEILNSISPHRKGAQGGKGNGENSIVPRRGSSPVDVVSQLIEVDDGVGLVNELISVYQSTDYIPTRVGVALLNKAALLKSFRCIDELLGCIPTLGDPSDISSRNFFHHHVIALGRKDKNVLSNNNDLNVLLSDSLDLEAAISPASHLRLVGAFGPDGINSKDWPESLAYVLGKLPVHLRTYLLQKDNYKRTPLHYAAQYGLVEVTGVIISFLKEWDVWDPNISIDDIEIWGDSEQLTPLHLAVIGTHPQTIKKMLSYLNPGVTLTTPRLLHLATRLNSTQLLESLLSAKGFDIDYKDPDNSETALYVACKLGLYDAAKYLIEKGANMEISEKLFGWTPIFAAVVEGYTDIVQLLISHSAKYELFDESGWTPMEHAALRGHLAIAEMVRVTDSETVTHPKFASNWNNFTKTDERAPRSKSICRSENGTSSDDRESCASSSTASIPYKSAKSSTSTVDKVPESNHSNNKRVIKKHLNTTKVPSKENISVKSVKSFGHNYLQKNESFILITMATNDNRVKDPPVSLNTVPLSNAPSTELDTALSLEISCPEDLDQQPVVVDLPLDDSKEPINFKVPYRPGSTTYTIYFDIIPTYGDSSVNLYSRANEGGRGTNVTSYLDDGPYQHDDRKDTDYLDDITPGDGSNSRQSPKKKILGRAVAFLDSKPKMYGVNRRPISEEVSIPIIGGESMDVLGVLRFDFLIVNPFFHDNVSSEAGDTYWKSLVSTRVIGHRGLGKNMNSEKSLQLGENTVESFIAAASLGASYVEFDVQLTKDDIPVVYHDFLVAESGVDIPMHELTLEQFMDLNSMGRDSSLLSRKDAPGTGNTNSTPANRRRLSIGDGSSEALKRSAMMRGTEEPTRDLGEVFHDRMRLTKTFKKHAFKANTRGHAIASSFVTLHELFKKIPKNVGFNIECKYPMVDEAEEEEVSPINVELNHWVDTVLEVVFENAKGRDIIFSSFQPNVCIMLSLKQPTYPILFLTDAGVATRCDARAASLQNAILFAHRWDLLGIVSAAAPIKIAPRLAQIVKSNGLVCVTYGAENNDPETARIQMDAGVDAVIVDSVLAVRRGLTRNAETTENVKAEE